MRKTIFGVLLLLILSMVTPAFAHPGRLDKNGGHNVNTAGYGYPVGSYHYHYGNDKETAYDKNGNVISKNGTAQEPAQTPAKATAPTPIPSPAPSVTDTVETNKIAVKVDGEAIIFDQPPENINGRIMVPIRYVVEKMGCSVEWDNGTQTVYINEAYIPPQKTAAKTDDINVYVNNEAIIFADQLPVNKNGRILIPVRFVTEKLGYSVEWDDSAQIVYINKSQSDEKASETVEYKVTRVVDGDTIEIYYNGATEKIRLIGVDTPESVHPNADKNIEYGKIASAFTTEYLLDKYVTLEFDVQLRDRYDRILAYVWIDGKMFNEVLLEYGHAKVATYPPNVKYVERFKEIQAAATASEAGLWEYDDAA